MFWPVRVSCSSIGGRVGEVEGVVEFAVGQESGIAGDVGAVEFEAEAAVELGSERLGLAVTHEDCLVDFGRKWAETLEFPGFWRNVMPKPVPHLGNPGSKGVARALLRRRPLDGGRSEVRSRAGESGLVQDTLQDRPSQNAG